MKLVDSQFDKNDKSTEAITFRSDVLNEEIDSQKQKIETLRSAIANAAESFGENDRRTQNQQIQLNNVQAALNGINRELSSNETPPLKKLTRALTNPEMKPRTSPIPSRKPTKPARTLTESSANSEIPQRKSVRLSELLRRRFSAFAADFAPQL